ncbi:MAG: hypothetical protein ACI8XM_002977 [Haloarculaceae archaeon]|jgi:hypothetical protein
MTTRTVTARWLPDGETLAWSGLLVTTEFLLVIGYVLLLDVTVTNWRLYVVPFVWINVGLWALVRTRLPAASTRNRRIAGAIAVGYFLLLAYFGGLLGPSSASAGGLSLSLTSLPPGWSPALLYNGGLVSVVLLPYKVLGYAVLAYLVYATALDAASALVGGLLGLFSCVSCTFPLIAGVVTGLAGSSSALASASTRYGYLLSTVVFVVTVALLVWRPSLDSVRRWPN